MVQTDQALLAEYLRGGDDAFRHLLERHAGLVYGVALRFTGDVESAREVVQDVFLILARKARQLITHPSVAAWLHRTTRNVARQARRSRICHDRKVERLAREQQRTDSAPATSDIGQALDEAIDRLQEREKEAIVLRFFQDREYAEIARQLKISEPAARKRVSRALDRLREILGSDATRGAALATLAVAAPGYLVASVLPSIPAAKSGISSLTLFIMMTKSSAIKVGAVALVGAGLLYFGVHESNERARIETLYEDLVRVHAAEVEKAAGPAVPTEPEGNPGRGPAARKPAVDAAVESIEALKAKLDEEVRKRSVAEAKLAELVNSTAGLEDEVVIAFGKVEEIGGQFGSLFSEALELLALEQAGGLASEEGKRRWRQFIENASSIGGLSDEIIGFEDDGEEGGRFFASTYGTVFGLDETQQAAIQGVFERHLAVASEKKLTLSNRPKDSQSEAEAWMEKRWEYFDTVRDDLRSAMPADSRKMFDELIEEEGYGFTNLKVNGVPLQFSMGGRQPEHPALKVKEPGEQALIER